MNSKVWVEIDGETSLAVRIFREKKFANQYYNTNFETIIREMRRALAVEQIRDQIFARDEFTCVHCGKPVTINTGEMHERQPRGTILKQDNGEYMGGEISIENGETRCTDCHTGSDQSAHAARNPHFTKKPLYGGKFL